MGLGKTVMVLAMLAARRDDPERHGRPSLIVVPRSLVHNWIAEAARFTPDLRVVDFSSSNRRQDAIADGADIVLVTYGTLRRDVLRMKDLEFDYVILDEAQAIKNAATASAKAARLLRGRHRLALTGTPIENHLGELWSLFEFLNPGILGQSKVFQRAASSAPDRDAIALLARGLRPFMLRRTKQQVATELPSKTEQTIACDLSAPERTIYEQLRRAYRQSVLARVERDGLKRSQMHILEALLRLRQAACHPALVDRRHAHLSSAKLDVVLGRVKELIDEGHKALVFSQFTSLLAILRRQLDADGVVYEYLDGRTRDRAERVARFQNDASVPLFLISLKAGGVGLNLTAAEYVFLLDPWWNPAVEAQAIDRTHRIGQTREVFAYRIVAADTIESKILELQERKRALADAILGGGAGGLKSLDRADLEVLLS
jgi:SNF2 family DNA or RNA helicase